MKYEKTNATTRKALAIATARYLHVSMNVGRTTDPQTGLIVPTMTPKGSGATARRAITKEKARELRRAAKRAS